MCLMLRSMSLCGPRFNTSYACLSAVACMHVSDMCKVPPTPSLLPVCSMLEGHSLGSHAAFGFFARFFSVRLDVLSRLDFLCISLARSDSVRAEMHA